MLKRTFLIVISAGLLALLFGVPHVRNFPQWEKIKQLPGESWDSFKQFAEWARQTNRYEGVALHLLRENRALKIKIDRLGSRLSELDAQKKFFVSKSRHWSSSLSRSPSSVRPVDEKNDLVQFTTYRWQDRKLLRIARREWVRKNYAKSAQYFYTLIQNYPQSPLINDVVLFQTAIASLQAEIYTPWAQQVLTRLIDDFPRSRYYRGAKLWMALVHFEQGDKERFHETLEEFRLKYRNTPEWKILSKHYEVPKRDFL